MYQLVIFDMDGTLADTSPGILNSHRHAHKAMGHPIPSSKELDGVIGGPLLQTYINRFGFSEADARTAVDEYRRYYSENGIHEAHLYPGMKEALQKLSQNHVKIALATLKAERFAKIMLKDMGILSYFDVVYGMDDQDTRTKSQLIEMCLAATGTARNDSLMVGDSVHDLLGAQQCGVPFLGVSYGFGFTQHDNYGVMMANNALEVANIVLSHNPKG